MVGEFIPSGTTHVRNVAAGRDQSVHQIPRGGPGREDHEACWRDKRKKKYIYIYIYIYHTIAVQSLAIAFQNQLYSTRCFKKNKLQMCFDTADNFTGMSQKEGENPAHWVVTYTHQIKDIF